MATMLLAFVVIAIMITGMAIGVILQNKPIKGTCGGIASLGLDKSCDICGGDTDKCDEEQERQAKGLVAKPGLAYDANEK